MLTGARTHTRAQSHYTIVFTKEGVIESNNIAFATILTELLRNIDQSMASYVDTKFMSHFNCDFIGLWSI